MAILTSAGIALVYSSINLRNSTKAYYHSKIASIYLQTCIEESVDRLKHDSSFVGEMIVSSGGSSCTVVVVDAIEPDVKSMSITSSNDQFSVARELSLDVSDYPFTIK